jgi:hypothetical protein
MTWIPAFDTDAEVRLWMRAKGWDVTGPEYDSGRQIYAWRARSVRSGHSPAVRISRTVLEDYPGFAVLELLDRLQVAAAIRRRPEAQYVVAQKGSEVALEEDIG